MDITFERDLDALVISRQTYTVLDFCSDVGGYLSLLKVVAGSFLFIENYNSINNYMVIKLYQVVDRPA